jgi:hypothetical protein
MSYTPPAANAVNFALVSLTPPAANAVNFELASSAGVTATLAATLGAATLSSTATVAANITATLAATLQAATLASTATVTPAAAAITATLAATLEDATLAATATVPAAPPVVPDNLAGGGGSGKTWRKRKEEADALKAAIRRAMYGAEDAVQDAVQAAPSLQVRAELPTLDLPQQQDYSTELAHLEAITAMLDRISREAPVIRQRRVAAASAKAKPKIEKVRKLLAMLDLVDA